MRPAFLNPRTRSLARGNVLVLGSLGVAILIAHPPDLRRTAWLLFPSLGCILGMAETARCLCRRWSFYHAAVMLCLYMDLLTTTLVLFFFLYPYFL